MYYYYLSAGNKKLRLDVKLVTRCIMHNLFLTGAILFSWYISIYYYIIYYYFICYNFGEYKDRWKVNSPPEYTWNIFGHLVIIITIIIV